MLRCLGLMMALFASAGPASAMDPSAMEETNCLMACDANQEHCAGNSPASAPRNYSLAKLSSPPQSKASPVNPSRRTSERR
ncbi:MAG: hypothetical protein ABJA75_12655 [Bradyrhizobium sp.]